MNDVLLNPFVYLERLGNQDRKSDDFLVGLEPKLARDLLDTGW